MFDEDLPKPKKHEFPRNLEGLSVGELNEYIEDLRAEIIKAEADREQKKSSMDAAANIFKS